MGMGIRIQSGRAVDEGLQRAALEPGIVRRVREYVDRHRTHQASGAVGRRRTWFGPCACVESQMDGASRLQKEAVCAGEGVGEDVTARVGVRDAEAYHRRR